MSGGIVVGVSGTGSNLRALASAADRGALGAKIVLVFADRECQALDWAAEQGIDTTLVPGHGTLVKKADLLVYRAMLVDVMAKVTALRGQGKSLQEVLAANLTAPYDKTTLGDTQQSKDRFITEAYDEVKDFPPVIDGKRTMPSHP